MLVDGTQINVGVAAGRLMRGSGLDGGNDGMTGGAGVDGSEVGMWRIAWIPWNYFRYYHLAAYGIGSHNRFLIRKKALLLTGAFFGRCDISYLSYLL